MTTTELLETFWREYDHKYPDDSGSPELDLCQCQTEPFIEGCGDPMTARAVLLVSDIIVQCLREFGFGRSVDHHPPSPSFTIPLKLAYVSGHSFGGDGPIGWVLRGSDGNPVKMNWKLATTVAGTMVGSIREWMGGDPDRAERWPEVAERLQRVMGEVWANDPAAQRRDARAWGLLPRPTAGEMYIVNRDSPSRGLEEALMPRVLGGLSGGWDPNTTSRDVARLVERTKRAARLAAVPYWALDGGPTGKDGDRKPFADGLAAYLRERHLPSEAVALTLRQGPQYPPIPTVTNRGDR